MRPEQQKEMEAQSKVDSRSAYEGRIVLRLDTYQFDQKAKIAEIIEHPGAVVVIPIDPQGRLILVRQWRRATGHILIELPAGTLEKGEEPIVCAQRELQEETGFRSNQITPLGGFYSAPGYSSEYLYLFLAEHLESAPLPPDDDEAIELVFLPLNEACDLIERGLICDAKTIAGILRYARRAL